MPDHLPVFPPELVWQLADRHGTPLWVYDAQVVRARISDLRAFETIRYAQKACSNIHMLRLMRQHGVKVDAVSHGEILRALQAGYAAGATAGQVSDIVFTADVLDEATLACVARHRIALNAGSLDMLAPLAATSPGHPVWLRINPGFGDGHSQKTNTGGPWSKHGIWHGEFALALQCVRSLGLQLAGLHMHIGSGVDYAHLQRVCQAMVELVQAAHAAGHDVPAISAGGGLPVPYRDGEARMDCAHYHGLWQQARARIEGMLGHPVGLEIEPGRFLVAESGVLLARVCASKAMGENHFVLVDAGFTELLRPALYGSHHAMRILRRDGQSLAPRPTVVAGPLCESGDVFTQDAGGLVQTRALPPAARGDLLVIHNTGAYGSSMSGNYNTRPLAAEVLVDGANVRLIRRRQTLEELLALEAGLE